MKLYTTLHIRTLPSTGRMIELTGNHLVHSIPSFTNETITTKLSRFGLQTVNRKWAKSIWKWFPTQILNQCTCLTIQILSGYFSVYFPDFGLDSTHKSVWRPLTSVCRQVDVRPIAGDSCRSSSVYFTQNYFLLKAEWWVMSIASWAN